MNISQSYADCSLPTCPRLFADKISGRPLFFSCHFHQHIPLFFPRRQGSLRYMLPFLSSSLIPHWTTAHAMEPFARMLLRAKMLRQPRSVLWKVTQGRGKAFEPPCEQYVCSSIYCSGWTGPECICGRERPAPEKPHSIAQTAH